LLPAILQFFNAQLSNATFSQAFILLFYYTVKRVSRICLKKVSHLLFQSPTASFKTFYDV
jgi:hypothetical protein